VSIRTNDDDDGGCFEVETGRIRDELSRRGLLVDPASGEGFDFFMKFQTPGPALHPDG
jgi:hypothetical protein